MNTKTPDEISGQAALEILAAHGAKFCKVASWDAPVDSPGKKPIGLGWQDKPLSLPTVTRHLANGGNVGLICGEHSGGLCLLDVDKNLPEFLEQHPQLATAPRIARAGADRGKIIIKIVGAIPKSKKLKNDTDKHPYLEFLSTGQQGVVAGMHPSGAIYRLINSRSAIPELTKAQLEEKLDGHSPSPVPQGVPAIKSRYKGLPDSIPDGSRNSAFTSYAGRLRYDGMNESDIWEAMLEANAKRARPPLDEAELKRIFDSVMRYPPGKRKLTDAGNAERLIDNYGADIAYVAKMGHWIIWNGKYWQPDRTGLIYSRALQTARKIYDEAMKTGEDLEARKGLLNHAMRSESRMKLAAMVEVAKTQQEIVIDPRELDADLHKLNVQNGTLNLETRRLEPHRQEDFITRALDIAYDPKANCPEWKKWLTWAFAGDEDLIHYMQQIVGRTLFGGNPEKELFFSYGATDTGKTTLMTLLEKLGGSYVKRFNIELLLRQPRSRNANDATPELAKLYGAHFAIGSEMPNGRKLDDAIVKDLSGRDTMTSRELHKPPFEYTPQFIIWLYGNYRPAIDAEDEALWNRMKVIPFRSIIPSNKKDPNLVTEKFIPELAGILKWAFEGAIEAYNTLLPVPAAVGVEKEDYRTDMDYVKQFVETGVLEEAPGYGEKMADIYKLFEGYILLSGLKHCPVNNKAFSHRLPKMLNAKTEQRHANQTFLVGWKIVGAENGQG
ncbi:MAG: phage/plasmid primase, P4 family [Anaerolineales bacterium]